MSELLVANKPIVVGTVAGPSARLRAGESIEASKVVPAYVEKVRSGVYASRARLEVAGAAEEGSENAEAEKDGEGSEELFDPTKHKVDDVLAYLEAADADEVARVQAIEAQHRGPGRPSKRVAEFEPKS